jgi:hypothetical protein
MILAAVAMGLWVRSVEQRRWSWMKQRIHELDCDRRSRDPSRPVLRGDPASGQAWGEYVLALKALTSGKSALQMCHLGQILYEFSLRSHPQNRSQVEEILATLQEPLDHLKRGVRRTQALDPDAAEAFREKYYMAQPAAGVLAWLSVCESKMLADSGQGRDAAELLLDAALFSRDVACNSTLLDAHSAYGASRFLCGKLIQLISSGRLSKGDCAFVERQLEILERAQPPLAAALKNNLWRMGSGFLEESFPPQWPRQWRFAYSQKLAIADAVDRVDSWIAVVARMEEMSSRECQTTWKAIQEEVDHDSNAITQDLYQFVFQDFGELKRLKVYLRLLRIAAHYRASGEVLELEDPMGTIFAHAQAGSVLKVWSEVDPQWVIEVDSQE